MYIPAALRAVLFTIFALLLLIYYGKSHFYRDPGSVFYDLNRAFERRYSRHREIEAGDYIRSVANNRSILSRAGDNPTICAAFSSVKRESVQYLDVRLFLQYL
jgi:hypothetical protein